MESPEEVAAAAAAAASYSSTDGGECRYVAAKAKTTSFTKRKRTKRGLRSFSFPPPAAPPYEEEEEEEDYFSTSTTTEEEEDMAHCLILLAQGRAAAAAGSSPPSPAPRELEKLAAATATGAYVYECKTCNKCFPSFQALGGHRASHKKPRPAAASTSVKVDTDRADMSSTIEIGMNSSSPSSSFVRAKQPPSTTAPPPANKLRVHECSICGSEFASGQALGGHMRRHRPVLGVSTTTAAAAESPRELPANSSSASSRGGGGKEEKKCSMLSLDLNLPAPSEEMADAFAFVGRRPLALVGCHY